VDLDEAERLDRGLLVVRGYGGDLVTDETDLFTEDRFLAAERGLRRIEAVKDGSYARQLLSLLRVYPAHARTRIRAPQHTRVGHAGQVHVLRIPRPARHTLQAVHPSARSPDLGEIGSARKRKILPLDEDERLEDLALELLAALDNAWHQDLRFPALTPAVPSAGQAQPRPAYPRT